MPMFNTTRAEDPHMIENDGECEEAEDTKDCVVVFQPGPRTSHKLDLAKQDKAFDQANNALVRDLSRHIDLSTTLKKADALFSTIMDPRNEETRRMVQDLFYEPMMAITNKAMEAIKAVDVCDPERASESLQLIPQILDVSRQVRDTQMDHVYDHMQKQIDHFSSSVETYNKNMKDSVMQTLELYQQRIDTEIDVRKKVLKQKREECAAGLELSMQEAEVHAANRRIAADVQFEEDEKKLAFQKQKDARMHDKALKEMERAEKKSQQELERQRKKDEHEEKKANEAIERSKKKDDAEHAKTIKDLEAKAKKQSMVQEARDNLMKELAIETARYNKEFTLAEHAMKDALTKRTRCKINHSAPKIEWSDPPRIVPGSVTWQSGGVW